MNVGCEEGGRLCSAILCQATTENTPDETSLSFVAHHSLRCGGDNHKNKQEVWCWLGFAFYVDFKTLIRTNKEIAIRN